LTFSRKFQQSDIVKYFTIVLFLSVYCSLLNSSFRIFCICILQKAMKSLSSSYSVRMFYVMGLKQPFARHERDGDLNIQSAATVTGVSVYYSIPINTLQQPL